MSASKYITSVIVFSAVVSTALPVLAAPVKWTFQDVTFQTFEGGSSTPQIDHPTGWMLYDADVFQGDRIIDWSIDFSGDGQRAFVPNVCPPECNFKNASQTDGPNNTDVFAFGGKEGTPQVSDFLVLTTQKLTDAGGRSAILDGHFNCCDTTTSFLVSGSLAAVPEPNTGLYFMVALIALCGLARWRSSRLQ